MLVERATQPDLPAIESLLASAELPLDGVAAAFDAGIIVRSGGVIVGAAAVERHGEAGLLRSVVVDRDRRGEGLGRTLVEAAEGMARDIGLAELYLLTETASDWFGRLGYAAIERDAVPDAVRGSVEFTTACSSTAVAMRRSVAPG